MPSEPSTADDLILLAASGARELTPADLRRVLAHVAAAGFDPEAWERAGGRLAGLGWQGRVPRGGDQLSPAEAHYLRHVVARREWPCNTALEAYLTSLSDLVLDPASGVLVCRYEGIVHLTVVRESGSLRGPEGEDWVLLDYRVASGRWVTAFQPREGLRILN